MTPKHTNMRKVKSVKYLPIVITALLSILAFGGGILAVLNNNIDRVNAHDFYIKNHPQPPTRSTSPSPSPTEIKEEPPQAEKLSEGFNLFIIGSDKREEGSEVAGMRSDVNILLHIPENKTEPIKAISIPRDTWVDIPSCVLPNGSQTKPRTTKFNAAFAYGGQTGNIASAIGCTLTTFTSLTGVVVDEAIVIDFNGFKHVINEIGGIEITIDQYIKGSKVGNLELQPGTHTLDGETALSYSRVRTGIGVGNTGDLGRISRQQQVMEALFNKVKTTAKNPIQVYNLAGAITPYLTLTEGLNIKKIADLGYTIVDRNVEFITTPHKDKGDKANVLWTDETDLLWDSIKGS